MKTTTHTLANGLRTVLIDTKAFPSLTVLLLVGAGSRYENPHNNGVAHFFEHMAFKGSKKYPNSFTITSTVESLGGVFNAYTGKDHTGYWIKGTAEHFATMVDVIADMVQRPLLESREIEREKGVIVEEINLYEDTPYRRVNEVFEMLLYPDSPLGYDIAGSKETVRSFNRKTFTSYIDTLYHPKNAVLVVAGGLEGNQKSTPIKSGSKIKNQNYPVIIEEKFAGWTNGKKAGFEKVHEKQSKPQIVIKYKKTEQAHFCLGFRAFSFFDDRRHALSVLSTMLGGGMSSPLFIEVRERRGLCYYISTSKELYHDAGNIVTQAGITNNADKVKEAIEVILKEHKKITKGQFKKEDLAKAKKLIKGRLLLSLEDSFNTASFFGTQKIRGESEESIESYIKYIEHVTSDEIVAVASAVFVPERLNFAMIGPFHEKKVFEEHLVL